MKEKIDKIYDKIVFILELAISLVFGINIFIMFCNIQEFRYFSIPRFVVGIFIGILLLALIIWNTIKYKKIVEKLFVTYIIPIGIMFMILIPINWIPDEQEHAFKTYDISRGNIITPFGENKEGDIYVPKGLLDIYEHRDAMSYGLSHTYLQTDANYDELVPVQTISKTYFPTNYISGAIVFVIGRTLNLNIMLTCYIIRLVNFLLTVLVGYYCIKIVPFGKLLFAIYMSLPMMIQQSASMSADVFVNGIILLFIVYNLKLLYQEKDLSLKQKIIYYILVLNISLCKYVYFPLVFMSLLLIKNKNISKKNKNQLIIIATILAVLASVAWFVFGQLYVDTRQNIIDRNVQPIEQIKYILKNPLEYVIIFLRTLREKGGFYINSFIGSELGLLNISIPGAYIITYIISLAILPVLEKNEKSLEKWQKWIMCGIVVILIALVITGLYLTWSPLQAELVTGVQGRYFIPVFILLLLAVINKNNKVEVKNLEIKYFALYFVLNLLVALELYKLFLI